MKVIAKWLLRGFSRRYDYDVSYLYELAEVSPGAFMRYLLIAPLSQYRRTAPADAHYAAKIVATRRADCGPCLQLVANMAREAGVDEELLAAILHDTPDHLNDNVRLAMRYADAVIDQNAVEVAETRDLVEATWGKAAVTDMSLAVTFGTFFPMLKRGLGHAQGCQKTMLSEGS